MLRTIIIDDEEKSRRLLKNLLKLLPYKINIIDEADDVESGISTIEKNNPDLVFLDIHLRTGLGFDILESIKKKSFKIIFTTAYDQYAIRAFRFSAIDYLLKPIDPELLAEALDRAQKIHYSDSMIDEKLKIARNKGTNFDRLALSTSEGIHFVNTKDIIYCKGEGSYTSFFLNNDKSVIISKGIKEYDELLKPQGFYRTHQSFLVNINQIDQFLKEDGGTLLMKNGIKIMVSRRKKEKLIEILLNHN